MANNQKEILLEIKNLDAHYNVDGQPVSALQDVNFSIQKGERVGLVGESGCGKSTLLKAIMGVLAPNAQITRGAIKLHEGDLLQASPEQRRQSRWNDIAMITQSALNALNPVHKIGDQIIEAIQSHRDVDRQQARTRATELFELVGVPPQRLDDFPHQFSGGMRQRAVIAMALALSPEIVLADEPTTALDVIVQDQIFERLDLLQKEQAFSMILVTHDLALVVESCSRIIVMYAGMIVETGPTHEVVRRPFHPYTAGLRYAIPDPSTKYEPISIPGAPPDLSQQINGCRFAPRCPLATSKCELEMPPLVSSLASDAARQTRCHHADQMDQSRDRFHDQSFWQTAKTTS
ncbi:peptide/nickel transport system ATP-binding protein [Maritalea mobilis]|jgi:peptide/nickel transport system ATP-binding protein|uniref:Peptide/nickel transport system ATP-binding protein n=1 Tax=Maritalea mobilis TaxID=483324 RepID=A0A4R6VQ91_9HYPH|nr:ABC transporter ATP-binding protein [Maritalea mobilis]TDQ64452.1 peptide/nickel transport system ATP-binding protein [Maritalea mobilis]